MAKEQKVDSTAKIKAEILAHMNDPDDSPAVIKDQAQDSFHSAAAKPLYFAVSGKEVTEIDETLAGNYANFTQKTFVRDTATKTGHIRTPIFVFNLNKPKAEEKDAEQSSNVKDDLRKPLLGKGSWRV